MIARSAAWSLLAVVASSSADAAAQRSGAKPGNTLPGFSPTAAATQIALEARVAGRPDSASARAHAQALAAEPHIAGTSAQARTRDYVIARMREWGLETEVREYEVWLPHATAVEVWRVAPDTLRLRLEEGPVNGDPFSETSGRIVMANGYSGSGDVTADVVYVNYGLIEDYAQLDSMGISVQGRIAVARYGRSFRGIKAREAERRGAVGLIIYSDPADDGFTRGDVYPDGPMRPPHAVQRGSVMNGAGDPSTPGWPSTRGARRAPASSMPVPRIPVVPLSYANAAELLRGVRGQPIPQSWQGGLPFRYHVGPGPVRVRMAVALDTARAALKAIWNTLGVIRGAELPDEYVVIGAHRDAWGNGAFDNVSGTVSVLEGARAVAAELREGRRPRRTIIFATWDAEEWGLVGSTEYVEDDSLRLARGGVAYLNQDVAASGPNFGGGGSPSLRSTLRDVVRRTADPRGRGSIYDVWRRTSNVADSLEPPMGDPGGGSDFAGFYNHLGIPHADWGFGGPGGVYHSAYDTPEWMRRFGDPDYRYHAAAARIAAAMVLRLANAEVLPYDYVEFARTMRRYLPPLERAITGRRWRIDLAPLHDAIGAMEQAATRFAGARDAALDEGARSYRARLGRANAALLRVERALTRADGLRGRPWYRSLIYVADVDNGYSTMVFPSVNEAVRAGDSALTERELGDLVMRFGAATKALEDATAALGGR